jgi:hypothetical protein
LGCRTQEEEEEEANNKTTNWLKIIKMANQLNM